MDFHFGRNAIELRFPVRVNFSLQAQNAIFWSCGLTDEIFSKNPKVNLFFPDPSLCCGCPGYFFLCSGVMHSRVELNFQVQLGRTVFLFSKSRHVGWAKIAPERKKFCRSAKLQGTESPNYIIFWLFSYVRSL